MNTIRMALLIAASLILAAGLADCLAPFQPKPTRTPQATEVIEAPTLTPPPDPTATPPAPQASATPPSPTPEAGAQQMNLSLTDPFPEPILTPLDHPQTAVLFLRDRSQSVYEVCGGRFTTAMAPIPRYIYHYLANNPALTAGNVQIGLGTFPQYELPRVEGSQAPQTPAVVMLAPLTPVDQIDPAAWQAAIDKAWDGQWRNNAQFLPALEESIEALEASGADRLRLVVFSDSVLDYHKAAGEQREWAGAIDKSDRDGDGEAYDYLTERLRESGVELHYVLYDCLPVGEAEDPLVKSFWANLKKWQDDIYGFQVDDDKPLDVDAEKQVKVYGWSEYTKSRANDIWQELTAATDGFPPANRLGPIVTGLLDGLLPAAGADDAAPLWQRRWLLAGSADAPAGTIELPIPGYARNVTIKILGFNDYWCLEPGDRHLGSCPNADGDRFVQEFDVRLNPPGAGCGGTLLTLTLRDPNSPNSQTLPAPLPYPTFVWWTIDEVSRSSLVATLDNVVTDPNGQGWWVESAESLTATFDWSPQTDGDSLDFLENCYRPEVVVGPAAGDAPPTAEAPAATPYQALWPHTYSLTFDPAQGNFVNSLTLQVTRVFSVPVATTDTLPPAPVSALPLENITFRFHPTLQPSDGAKFVCQAPNGYTSCQVSLDLLYTTADHYADGQARRPDIYLLADSEATPKDGCMQEPSPPDATFTGLNADGAMRTWAAQNLADGLTATDLTVNGKGFSYTPSGSSTGEGGFLQDQVDNCGYTFLLLTWDDGEQVYCPLWNGACVQENRFTPVPVVEAAP